MAQAEALGPRLAEYRFTAVLTSPLRRARQTCELAGLGGEATVDPDLAEWDYGDYEGLTTPEIRAQRPGWELFADGAPGGETAADVGARVDRVIGRVRSLSGEVALVAHSHVLRVLAVRWTADDPTRGRSLVIGPASISELGWEREHPVIRSWNR